VSGTSITARLDGAANVLLEVPPMGGGRDACTSLLTEAVESPSVLFVTYTRGASECAAQVAEASVANVGVVSVGDAPAGEAEGVRTESVSSASDLTGLGIAIGKFLSEWEDVVVCFDSLTSMLQYVDFETAYEFLHAITGQVYAADARAHFHVDPEAHDEQQVAGITSLFDARVDPAADEVRSRDLIS
jgi:hypothetical protein